MASRGGGGFTGLTMNTVVNPMNVAHSAGMRMPGMPQAPAGYSRTMTSISQYPQVGFLLYLSLLNGESLSERLTQVNSAVGLKFKLVDFYKSKWSPTFGFIHT